MLTSLRLDEPDLLDEPAAPTVVVGPLTYDPRVLAALDAMLDRPQAPVPAPLLDVPPEEPASAPTDRFGLGKAWLPVVLLAELNAGVLMGAVWGAVR